MATYDPGHIISVLSTTGVVFTQKGNEIKMECMFHPDRVGRPDRSQNSLQLRCDGAKAHCWSCHWKGSWIGIARALGVDPGKRAYDTGGVERTYDEVFVEDAAEIVLPTDLLPWKGSWRELPFEFLNNICYAWYDPDYRVDRILFPDIQHDGLIWVAGCARTSDGKRLGNNGKYRNAKGHFAAKKFFGEGAITASGTDVVALVEGPYDALRFRYYGIPTLALLGTANWNDDKAKRLARLGVETVYSVMDGDPPGRKCARAIKHIGKDYFSIQQIKLPNETDPGDIPVKLINRLRKLIVR